VSVAERNLLADAAKIVETNKNLKHKDELRKIVTDGLLSLGYDSAICKSKWDKSSSFPAGTTPYKPLSLFYFSELQSIFIRQKNKNKINLVVVSGFQVNTSTSM
jgi:hypothetical protein